MFDLAIDSKLRGCDIVKIRTGDLVSGGRVRSRAIIVQRKTGRPVQFELLEPARASIFAWLELEAALSTSSPSPVGPTTPSTSALGSTPGSLTNGSPGSDCAGRITGRTHFAGQRHPSSTSRPATYEPCRSYSAIRKSRARCDT